MSVWRIIGFCAGHYLLSIVTAVYVFSASMNRFETLAPVPFLERACEMVQRVLWFPLAWLALENNFGHSLFAGHFVVLMNSLLWGILFNWAWLNWRKHRTV